MHMLGTGVLCGRTALLLHLLLFTVEEEAKTD